MNIKLKSVVHDVYEVNLAAKKVSKGASLITKEPMPVPKISFASCVDHTNLSIYTIGGQDISRSASASCEVYSISENSWKKLPNLTTAVYSASCVISTKN